MTDWTAFATTAANARALLVADAGRLWGGSLAATQWMGIESDTIVLTADPEEPSFRQESGLWIGARPADVALASTAVEWANRRWAGVELPLPADSAAATRLLLHEACHVAQPELLPKHPASTESRSDSDQLDTADGRTWLRLELLALGRALVADDRSKLTAAGDVVLFRRRRYAAASPAEQRRQTALEIAEGIPEYTAWRLSEAPASAVVTHAHGLESNPATEWSQVRAFAYHTGPAYGYLLDGLLPDWRSRLRDEPDLPALVASTVTEPSLDRAEQRGDEYGLAAIRREEETREADTAARKAEIERRFADQPLLRIRFGRAGFTFDPRAVIPIGMGTVYPGLRWQSGEGSELVAPEGALVTDDWSELVVPLDEQTFASGPPRPPTTIIGSGWQLRLTAEWHIRIEEGSRAVTDR